MKKRIFAAILWFNALWFVGSFAAFLLGVSPVLGPILGTSAAVIIAGDPRRLIWARPLAVSPVMRQRLQNLA
jgi:hypothetical protein